MEWMTLPLKRYADFSGRSRRLEYWMYTLFLVLVTFASIILAVSISVAVAGGNSKSATAPLLLVALIGFFFLAYLAVLVPTLAVQVRRFHDQDLSGWFVLLGFIPYLGALIMLIFMCIDGTPGPNRFGPDPKGRGEGYSNVFA